MAEPAAVSPVLVRLASRMVPERWRSAVLRDLAEESARQPRRWPALWIAGQLLAIGARLRRRAFTAAWPSADGVFTGFHRDVVSALRHLRRTPASSAMAVVTLSLAVAAVVTVMAILHRTVLRPLVFRDADRLTAIWRIDPVSPDNWLATTPGDFVDWKQQTRTFQALVAGRNISMAFTGFDDGASPLMRRVTYGWFETLGVTPVLGRTFTAEEDRPNGPPVAMLSHATWQERFGARDDVIGRTVELDGTSHAIVGVLPASYFNPVFGLVDYAQVYLPLGLADAGESRAANTLLTIGRLAPGATLEDARAEVASLSESQARSYPETNRQFRATVQKLDEQLVRPVRTPLALLLVAVVGLLLAACGNVANLQLVRAIGRRQEHAVQQALGASRLRLLLQQLSGSLMIAGVAGVIAVALAAVAGPAAQRLTPPGLLAPQVTFALGPASLAFAGGITLVAGLLSSIPALLACGRRLVGTELSAGAMRSIGARERRRWASTLVAVEVAVAVTLLTGAGLAVEGMAGLQRTSHGFDERNAVTFRVSTRGPEFTSADARFAFFERILEEFRGLPGVAAAGGMNALPIFGQFNERAAVRGDVPGQPTKDAAPRLSVIPVTDGFFAAMGMAVRDGRDFTSADRMDTPPAAILSRSAAARLFGEDRATGRSLILFEGTRERRADVVGLVDDVRSSTDPTVTTAVAYVPWRQAPAPTAFGFVLRSPETPATLHRKAQAAVARINRSMPIYLWRPLSEVAAALIAAPRFTSALLTAFAGLGLALVVSGLYGTLTQLVTERRRELALRLALGATRGSVLHLVLTDGLRPALAGLALGWIAALGFGQVIASAVAGTPAFKWTLFLALPVGLLGLCVLASVVPGLRATRVDPTAALRAD